MWWMSLCCMCLMVDGNVTQNVSNQTAVVVVVGEPGAPEYEEQFARWALQWSQAAQQSGSQLIEVGPPQQSSIQKEDHELLRLTFEQLAQKPPDTLWIVLIGHGTFDGKKARFNLRGPDMTAAELSEWLQHVSSRIAIINSSSASGPFINTLSGPDRAIVTATQSGFEYNFARFGGHMAQAIGETTCDLDKDGQTSLLEAWLAASKRTQESYDAQAQLATEHALLDDNGDGIGTPADFFRGLHVVKTSKDQTLPDGTLANQFLLVTGEASVVLTDEQRQTRDQLERELAALREKNNQREKKTQLQESDYLKQLEEILIPLAHIYEEAKRGAQAPDNHQ